MTAGNTRTTSVPVSFAPPQFPAALPAVGSVRTYSLQEVLERRVHESDRLPESTSETGWSAGTTPRMKPFDERSGWKFPPSG